MPAHGCAGTVGVASAAAFCRCTHASAGKQPCTRSTRAQAMCPIALQLTQQRSHRERRRLALRAPTAQIGPGCHLMHQRRGEEGGPGLCGRRLAGAAGAGAAGAGAAGAGAAGAGAARAGAAGQGLGPPGRTLWLPPGPAAARDAAGDAAAAPAAPPGPFSPSALVASSSAPARRHVFCLGACPRLRPKEREEANCCRAGARLSGLACCCPLAMPLLI